jgi:murein DD-endopeptidase MepM/ murein hydrolase activator NlpD
VNILDPPLAPTPPERPPHRSGRRLLLPCLAATLVVVALWLGLRSPRQATADAASLPAAGTAGVAGDAAPAPAAAPEPLLVVEHAALGRGGTLADALSRLGLDGALREQVVAALAEEVDPRRLPAAAGLAVARDADGALHSLTLRHTPRHYVRVRFGTDGGERPVTETHEVPVVARVVTAGGLVSSSVAQALADSPDAVPLTVAVADILQWDVDLLTDPRPGDAVSVIYEVLRRGELPADLARFDAEPDRAGEVLEVGRVLAASYRGARAAATAFWVEGGAGSGAGDYFDAAGSPLRKAFLKSPLNYTRISSRFSNARRHPVTRKVTPHHGVDFVAARGTPVVSTADGRVIAAGWSGPLGRAVRIRHGSEYVTIYGHLQGYARGVRVGATVRQNQVIGYVGSSGRATGPHVHYTVQHAGRSIDPLRMENPPAKPLDPAARPALERSVRDYRERLEEIRRSLGAVTAGNVGEAAAANGT